MPNAEITPFVYSGTLASRPICDAFNSNNAPPVPASSPEPPNETRVENFGDPSGPDCDISPSHRAAPATECVASRPKCVAPPPRCVASLPILATLLTQTAMLRYFITRDASVNVREPPDCIASTPETSTRGSLCLTYEAEALIEGYVRAASRDSTHMFTNCCVALGSKSATDGSESGASPPKSFIERSDSARSEVLHIDDVFLTWNSGGRPSMSCRFGCVDPRWPAKLAIRDTS